MTDPEIRQEIVSIILIGDFNPSIFHPQWLAANKLISNESANAATSLSCQSEFSTFEVDDMKFIVEKDRFQLTTKDPTVVPIFLITFVGIFSLLEHTPLHAIGLNHDYRYSMPDLESWHKLGHTLAPKDRCWNDLLEDPGMAALTIRGKRQSRFRCHVDIRVNPIWDEKNGVFIGINQHYHFKDLDLNAIAERNRRVLNIIDEDWVSFTTFSNQAVNTIFSSINRTDND